jgi:hypothetical protein
MNHIINISRHKKKSILAVIKKNINFSRHILFVFTLYMLNGDHGKIKQVETREMFNK